MSAVTMKARRASRTHGAVARCLWAAQTTEPPLQPHRTAFGVSTVVYTSERGLLEVPCVALLSACVVFSREFCFVCDAAYLLTSPRAHCYPWLLASQLASG